jgi:Flp pilus assembly protein TadD
LGGSLAHAQVMSGREEHVSQGLALYAQMVAERPENPWLHYARGVAFRSQHRFEEAEVAFREATRLKPDFLPAYTDLGALLCDRFGRYKEAEVVFRETIRLQPDSCGAHDNLGVALHCQGYYKEAELEYREALRLAPDFSGAHCNLGINLGEQRRYKEAEAEFGEALRLKPDFPEAHDALGTALRRQGRYKEAEAEHREALRLKPDFARARDDLGSALYDQAHYQEAEAAFREAIRLEPDSSNAHSNLGNALLRRGRYKDAQEEYLEALRLKPDFPGAHNGLGTVLLFQGRYKEAEAEYHEALRLEPDFANAHCNLGLTLREQGRFTEALESFHRGHTLGSKTPGWRYPSADWVSQCKHLVELDRRLPDILRGDDEPASAAERLEFAVLCGRYKRYHVGVVRLSRRAFTADPKLADDLQSQPRYNAACSATLAAAEQGEDARQLPDKVVLTLRHQALQWLRADLALYAKAAERADVATKQAVQQRLTHWQKATDLATVRDRAALDQLPEHERRQWRQFWDDVTALLAQVGAPK